MRLLVPLLLVQTLLICLLLPHSVLAGKSIHKKSLINNPKKSSNMTDILHKLTRYFPQNLDHFDYTPESYKTFKQRYMIHIKNWAGAKNRAPIFVHIGNQDDMYSQIMSNYGFMTQITKHFNSAAVCIEHRYYGESIPFGSKEVAFKNSSTLGYLNTKQALADVATMILHIKEELKAPDSPVVVFGNNYGGILAAWFRLKYPHIAIGAMASSAPILDFDNMVSPYKFNDIIAKNFKDESESCYKFIKNSWNELKKIMDSKDGIKKLSKTFKICNPTPPKKLFQERLFEFLEFAYTQASIHNYPIKSEAIFPLPPHPVKKMCEAIDNPRAHSYTASRLYGAMNLFYNYTKGDHCFNFSNTVPDTRSYAFKAMEWQVCTELIEHKILDNKESIFPSTFKHLDNLLLKCNKLNVKPRPHWITTEFGGHNMKRVLKRFASNIIFYNGEKDPNSDGGVMQSISKSIVAIVAPEGAHYVDYLYFDGNVPEWLKTVRRKEFEFITKWLKEYNEDLKVV